MTNHLPTHVAIIPDGNRRWSKLVGLSPRQGHQAGAKAMHTIVDLAIKFEIKYLTLWGFSTDNWKRSKDEISSIFQLLAQWIERDTPWLNENGVNLRFIGRISELPKELQATIRNSVAATMFNPGMTLALAFNYGGRAEILDAVNSLVRDDLPWKIDEKQFSSYLYTKGMPDVDLVIRTAGEVRLSNFLIWQTAYSEYYFTPTLWPDFGEDDFKKALEAYSESKRSFGGD